MPLDSKQHTAAILQRLDDLEIEHDLRRDPSPLFSTASKRDLIALRTLDEPAYVKLTSRWQADGLPRLAELKTSLDRYERRVTKSWERWQAAGEFGLEREKGGKVIPDATKADLPAIQMIEANLPEVIAQAEAALIAAGADVFQANGRLVHMFRHNDVDGADTTEETLTEEQRRALPLRRDEGALVIDDIGARALQVKLAETARWFKWAERRHDWAPAAPKPEYALHLIEQPGWGLRVLRGTVTAPTLRATGSVLQRPGYDRRSELFFDSGGATFAPVPEKPTREDGVAALACLKEVIKDFPFVLDDEYSYASAGRSVALSAILTGLVRRTLETAPAHAFDAPQAGSGKTKLTEIAAAIASGHKPTMISQGATEEESNKRLFAVLRAGDQAVCWDNIDREVRSDELCTALTSPVMQGRILGESKTATVATNVLIMLNGNNLVVAGDLTDRTIVCRLEPGIEDPKSRRFDREPVAFALANREELVVAGLTVLRAHIVAGYPGLDGLTPSRFPDWDRVVRAALVWLGESDPQATAVSLKTVDPERDDLRTLMRAWESTIGIGSRVTAHQIIDLATLDDFHTEGNDEDLHDALDVVLPRVVTTKSLGKYLAKAHNRIVGGRVIRMHPDTKAAASFWMEIV